MAVIVPVNIPQGIGITEQKCYLQHAGDNQAIINCLDAVSLNNGHFMFGTIAVILITMWLASR